MSRFDPPPGDLSGAIIAGGANTRFGGERKGLAPVAGTRIIDRVAAAIRAITGDVTLVANADDASGWLPGVPVRRDARPEHGSAVGLHTALSGSTEATIVVAWDMPFVSPALLALIAGRLRAGALAVVPEDADGLQPFCAGYTKACLPEIERAIERRDFRMSNLVARLPGLATVGIDEVRAFGDPRRLFFNVNDHADLAEAERLAAIA